MKDTKRTKEPKNESFDVTFQLGRVQPHPQTRLRLSPFHVSKQLDFVLTFP